MALDILVVLVAIGLQQGVTVGLAAQGELLTEKAGILNIGLEGVMLLSSFSAAYGNWFFERSIGAWSSVVGILVGMAVGMVSNFLFSFISTNIHVDQVIRGSASTSSQAGSP
jgi:simple sugar transport system permease protein